MAKIVITQTVIYEKGDIYNMTREEQNALIIANLSPQIVERVVRTDLFPRALLLEKTEQSILLVDELCDNLGL